MKKTVLLCSLLIAHCSLLTSCVTNKEHQINREVYTVLYIDTVYRENTPMALITWQDSEKMQWVEFKNFPVFEKPHHHYEVIVRRNFIK